MKVCYKHFPIVTVIYDEGDTLEIKHYLGEASVKRIRMHEGCKVFKINDQTKKDDIWVQGNDIEKVSLSCISLHTNECLFTFL